MDGEKGLETNKLKASCIFFFKPRRELKEKLRMFFFNLKYCPGVFLKSLFGTNKKRSIEHTEINIHNLF